MPKKSKLEQTIEKLETEIKDLANENTRVQHLNNEMLRKNSSSIIKINNYAKQVRSLTQQINELSSVLRIKNQIIQQLDEANVEQKRNWNNHIPLTYLKSEICQPTCWFFRLRIFFAKHYCISLLLILIAAYLRRRSRRL